LPISKRIGVRGGAPAFGRESACGGGSGRVGAVKDAGGLEARGWSITRSVQGASRFGSKANFFVCGEPVRSLVHTERAGMPRDQPALRVVPLSAPLTAAPEALDLDALFRRYSPYVAAVAYRLLGRDEEVDDTVQEVFLAAVRGLRQIRDPGAVKGWLARITVRTARHRLERRRLRRLFGLDDPVAYESVADASASAEQRATIARVYRVLDGLPPA